MRKEFRMSMLQIKPGMKVSEPVYTGEGQLLIPGETVLTPKLIMKLGLNGIDAVEISKIDTTWIKKELVDAHVDRMRQTAEFRQFNQAHTHTVKIVKATLSSMLANSEEIDTKALLTEINKILNLSCNGMQLFEMLYYMRYYDDDTYSHCVNVGLICNVLARWLHFSEDDIELVTIAGLLHDVGKLLMPVSIIKKPGALTQTERMTIERHPYVGYQILKREALDERICRVALEHHEKCDGTGYPCKVHGDKISKFSKVATIADVYEAMTANRVYRTGLCPFNVIEMLETEGFQKYETQYLLVFLEGMAETYINKTVLLNDKRQAQVIMINKHRLSRPVVRYDKEYLDLAKIPMLSIEAVL